MTESAFQEDRELSEEETQELDIAVEVLVARREMRGL